MTTDVTWRDLRALTTARAREFWGVADDLLESLIDYISEQLSLT